MSLSNHFVDLRHLDHNQLEKYGKYSNEKKYLTKDSIHALVALVSSELSKVYFLSSHIDRDQSLLHGFMFSGDTIPSKVIIKGINEYEAVMSLNTFGKKVFMLDAPIPIVTPLVQQANISFDIECECKYIVSQVSLDIYKTITSRSFVIHHDGYIAHYVDGLLHITRSVRPLRNIVQDIVKSDNKMLMMRSYKDIINYTSNIYC